MTAIQLCNNALTKNSHYETLLSDALTNPVGKASLLCAAFWDNARREILRLSPWTCAKVREELINGEWIALESRVLGDQIVVGTHVFTCTAAGISGATIPATWSLSLAVTDGTAAWAYATGQDRITAIPTNLSPYTYAYPVPADFIRQIDVLNTAGSPVDFIFEAGVIYTDTENPILVFVFDQADPTVFDPLLLEAITTQLASKLAYPLTGSHENEVAFAQAAMGIVQAAVLQSKREQRQGPAPADSWMDGLWPVRK